jgi:hypothetical protein
MPTPTDLVTDLPADVEVFGQAVDTSLADLQGGTTGQILSKASNTNMDFTWITNDVGDITAVNVTAPITGGGSSGAVTIGVDAASTSAAGVVQLSDSTSTTSSVLASTPTATKSAYDLAAAAIPKSTVTTAGDVIYATGSAAVTRLGIGSTGQVLTVAAGVPSWATPASAGVNLLLNSNFAINQRAYVSAANLASGSYGFDRWKSNYTNTTLTFTASTQGQSLTINANGGLQQVIEQGLVSAGTYTLSWTGTATARVYNSGGTPPSYAASPVTFTADGTANVVVEFTAVSTTKTVSKVQFNLGTNTSWALATPTLQSELAACQRYYYQSDTQTWTNLQYQANVNVSRGGTLYFPQTMRTTPTLTLFDSPGNSGKISVSAGSGGYSDNITPNMFGTGANTYAYYAVGSYVLGYTSKFTASAEL